MKVSWMVSELWSGHEKLTDGQIDGRRDRGHDIIRPVFDGRIKTKMALNYPKYNNVYSYGIFSLRTQEWVRNSRGKRAINVWANKVMLYMQKGRLIRQLRYGGMNPPGLQCHKIPFPYNASQYIVITRIIRSLWDELRLWDIDRAYI